MLCIDSILRHIPRDYTYAAAADIDGELTMILVLKAGDDEDYLRRTLELPEDETFRQAVHAFMKPGVWPTHR